MKFLVLLLIGTALCGDYTLNLGYKYNGTPSPTDLKLDFSKFNIPSGSAIKKITAKIKCPNGGCQWNGRFAVSRTTPPYFTEFDSWNQPVDNEVSIEFTDNAVATTINTVDGSLNFGTWWFSAVPWELEAIVVTTSGSGSGSSQGSSQGSGSGSSGTQQQTVVIEETPYIPKSGSCPIIKQVAGGWSGSGYATRYWDCCKPHCSWSGKGGPIARQCNKSDQPLTTGDDSQKSTCDGGESMVCLSQIPFTLDGCDEFGFAFAAFPGGEKGGCGKCFRLQFTGEGKYETKENHQKLKGKSLIVMASNIGYDVVGGQFDIMIPGGGVGIFNGCGHMWQNSKMGAQYGGLLSDCENSVGYSGDIYNNRKQCLKEKCKDSFSGKAQQGCLFLANFMEAAGNPTHTYYEIECPSVLSDEY